MKITFDQDQHEFHVWTLQVEEALAHMKHAIGMLRAANSIPYIADFHDEYEELFDEYSNKLNTLLQEVELKPGWIKRDA